MSDTAEVNVSFAAAKCPCCSKPLFITRCVGCGQGTRVMSEKEWKELCAKAADETKKIGVWEFYCRNCIALAATKTVGNA